MTVFEREAEEWICQIDTIGQEHQQFNTVPVSETDCTVGMVGGGLGVRVGAGLLSARREKSGSPGI